MRRFAAIVVAAASAAACQADWTVNINARYYGFNFPTDPAPQVGQQISPFTNAPDGRLLQLTLPAGHYRISNAAGQFGADPDFTAWNYSGGWVWNFVMCNHADNHVVLYVEAGGVQSSQLAIASQDAVQHITASFMLTETTTLDFMIRDYYLGDNAGGVAVRIAIDCPADFNRDGFVDGFDYDDFVACFEGQGCPSGTTADFTGDGFVDGFDYDAFVEAFETSCV